MKPDTQLMDMVSSLTLHCINGTINEQGLKYLETLLENNPLAVEYYLEIVWTHIGLNTMDGVSFLQEVNNNNKEFDLDFWRMMAEAEETALTVEIPKEEIAEETDPVIHPAREEKPISKFKIFTLITCAAAMLFFALFIKFAPEPLPRVEVATLVDQMNIQWAESSVDFENGDRLLSNDYPLNLKKGLFSIAYDQGVKVVVEGPALFEIERSGIFLEYGRLYSNVSDSGLGFTVETPNSQFVDMGTEFGVKVEIDGSSELHVTKGKVQFFAGAKGKSRTGRMVTENKAMRYSANSGLVKDIRVKKNTFVRKINSAFNQIWKGPSAYERAVQKTRPLHYWRFDEDRDGLLRNEMDSSLNDEYKLFGSLVYSDGPDLGAGKNAALRLTGSEDDYAILRDCTDEADNADGFTIATWVRPNKAYSASKKNIIMRFRMADKDKGVGARRNLGFDEENRFYFNANALSNEDAAQKEYRERISIQSNPVAVNRWHHVVVSYTKNDRVNLYVDGELQATQEILSFLEPANKNSQWCLGSAVVQSEYRQSHTSFAGSLDEISHYDRELSAEEVGMLYEASGQK